MMKAWLMAIRPKTLTAGLSPVLLGLAMASVSLSLSPSLALLTLSSCLCLQVAANLANDYFDYITGVDSEKRLGPQRVTQSGLLPPEKVKWGLRFSLLLGFTLGLALIFHGGIPILIIGILSMIFAYVYTGGPYPLSHLGLGEVLAFLFFGPVAVAGTYYLQTLQFSIWPVVVGLAPGFLAATLMSVNNLRDRESDALAGKKTLAVLLGKKKARIICLCFVAMASLIPLLMMIFWRPTLFFLLSGLSFLLFWNVWKKILLAPISSDFNQLLAATGKFLFLHSLLFALGFVV